MWNFCRGRRERIMKENISTEFENGRLDLRFGEFYYRLGMRTEHYWKGMDRD